LDVAVRSFNFWTELIKDVCQLISNFLIPSILLPSNNTQKW
jgi:hypothetical protein